jgi:hypothetical protein
MNRLNILLCAVLLALAPLASAQFPSKCIATIQARLEQIGQSDRFNLQVLRDKLRAYDIGQWPAVAADPVKADAFKRVYTSLAEFVDLSGTALSQEGMRGYARYAGCILKPDGNSVTDDIANLKSAFTKNNAFEGGKFDDIMRQLADESLFEVDGATRTFRLKQSPTASGFEFGLHPSGQWSDGERHAITHVMRGHIDNDSVGNNTLFRNHAELFDILVDGYNLKGTGVASGPYWKYEIDMSHRVPAIGANGETKLRVVVFKDSTGSATPRIVTAYPIP